MVYLLFCEFHWINAKKDRGALTTPYPLQFLSGRFDIGKSRI